MTFKSLKFTKPTYLNGLLHKAEPKRALRSISNGFALEIPYCKTVIASQAFSVVAPKVWNNLPKLIRDLVSVDAGPTTLHHFKKQLKFYLYTNAFSNVA